MQENHGLVDQEISSVITCAHAPTLGDIFIAFTNIIRGHPEMSTFFTTPSA